MISGMTNTKPKRRPAPRPNTAKSATPIYDQICEELGFKLENGQLVYTRGTVE